MNPIPKQKIISFCYPKTKPNITAADSNEQDFETYYNSAISTLTEMGCYVVKTMLDLEGMYQAINYEKDESNVVSIEAPKVVDELGRLLLPKSLRKSLRIEVGDELAGFAYGNKIKLQKHIATVNRCPTCGSTDSINLSNRGIYYACGCDNLAATTPVGDVKLFDVIEKPDFTCTVDSLGRITIPAGTRKTMQIKEHASLLSSMQDGAIFLENAS